MCLVEAEGLTARQAGQRLGVTKNAVIGKAHRLGLRFARSPERRIRLAKPVSIFPEPGRCLFGLGDPKEPDFHFCGAAAADGSPYCEEHGKAVHIPPGKRAAFEAAIERAAAFGGRAA